MVTRKEMGECRGKAGFGVNNTLLNMKEINKGLPNTTENYYIQYLVKPYNGEESEKEYVFQFSLVSQSCLTLCNPMNRSTPGLPVHHRPLESTQTHVH